MSQGEALPGTVTHTGTRHIVQGALAESTSEVLSGVVKRPGTHTVTGGAAE